MAGNNIQTEKNVLLDCIETASLRAQYDLNYDNMHDGEPRHCGLGTIRPQNSVQNAGKKLTNTFVIEKATCFYPFTTDY